MKLLADAEKSVLPTLPCLKDLTLYGIDYGSVIMVSCAIELICCSPALEDLWISGTCKNAVLPPEDHTTEVDCSRIRQLGQLRKVVFGSCRGLENEVCLIKTLLACSPVLEEMSVISWYVLSSSNQELGSRDRLRPPISSYPVNQQDEIRRTYIRLGPYQLVKSHYPLTPCGPHKRSFQASWFKRFWLLEYSDKNDAAFCFPCYLFGRKPIGRVGSDTFSLKDFTSWRKVNGGKHCPFVSHEGSSTKRNDQLQDAQLAEISHLTEIGELEGGRGSNQLQNIQKAGDTRWSSHFKSICSCCDCLVQPHHYRVDVFIVAIDSQLQELNNIFNESVSELLILSVTMDPRISFNANDICKLVTKYYPLDFTEQKRIEFRLELQHYELDNDPRLKNISSLSELCRALQIMEKSEMYPLIDRLVRLILTFPVSTATSERAFSKMKLVKTRLRSTMSDDFLKSSMILSIEREIVGTLCTEKMIDDFYCKSQRRVQMMKKRKLLPDNEKRASTTFPCLKDLTLHDIDFSSDVMTSLAIELIGAAPNSETLCINATWKNDVPPPEYYTAELD
ncbi:hypothetical protein CTI12_AA453750 [Artemisia annua]|uniref:TTF-type domain-containing protein n=1 Tax=Artemisia annua TaxID=35608 RepID=A0A2U1LU78_ARTAN|nr:hypothetical protein CTI12_AA453750 [Artemisia annua]